MESKRFEQKLDNVMHWGQSNFCFVLSQSNESMKSVIIFISLAYFHHLLLQRIDLELVLLTSSSKAIG